MESGLQDFYIVRKINGISAIKIFDNEELLESEEI